MKTASIPATIGSIVTASALLSACSLGSSEDAASSDDPANSTTAEESSDSSSEGTQRAKEGRISVEIPESWTETPDFNPTMNGFTTSWANDQDEPTDIVRMSSDQGQGPTATANMGYFEANALFRTTHGTEFELGESRDLDIENADEAKLTTWTTRDTGGSTVKGAWVFVSDGDNSAAGVEIMAITLSDDEIEAMIDSVQFDPDA